MATKIPKVPVILQMESLECGAASLSMILAYYGRWVPLETLRAEMGVGRDGSNARSMCKVGRSYGLECAGYKFDVEMLKTKATFPCVLFWQNDHFLVLRGFKRNEVYLTDPGSGEIIVPIDEFTRRYSGICIQFAPTENFVKEGSPKSVVNFARQQLKGYGSAFAYITIASLLVSITGALWALTSQAFVDRFLLGNAHFVPFLCVVAAIILITAIVTIRRQLCVMRALGVIEVSGTSRAFTHITHLPMEFFAQRMAGDLISRLNSWQTIAQTLVNSLIPTALNAVMLLVYLFVMIRVNLMLAMIGLASTIVNLFVMRYVSRRLLDVARLQQRDAGRLTGESMSGLSLIETIKSSASEPGWFRRWAGYQSNLNNTLVRLQHISCSLGTLPSLFMRIANSLVLVLGVKLIIEGKFTLGTLSMFQGLMGYFQAPVQSLAMADQDMQLMQADMERVEDVLNYPEDSIYNNTVSLTENASKIRGHIELRDVTFGYSKSTAPVIDSFNIEIKPGSRVAFVGGSGSGKSTLSKLISGLYKPWSGEILYDGKPLNEIPRPIFTSSVAVVDQEITLFGDTVAENIRLWDKSIEDFEIIMAARDAHIHDEIVVRTNGYDHVMLENGRDFSGGQRQRIEIARVLAMDPSVLILDEATSALDAKTEKEVMDAIRDRGITQIIIAHRLSTVRDCDEIIVMDGGVAIERGTHDELMALDGKYADLVRLS